MVTLASLWMRDPFLLSLPDVRDAAEGPISSRSGANVKQQQGSDKRSKGGKQQQHQQQQQQQALKRPPALERLDDVFWMYGTTDKPPDDLANPYGEFPGTGFQCYCSEDLVNWRGPFQAFKPPPNFWADTQYWAPEVHLYKGRLVMLATMKKSGKGNERGVAVLESPMGRPEGPFKPVGRGPVTPKGWACLDGTLLVEDGAPFLVFCREWTQCRDGQMCVVELKQDLSGAKNSPSTLFSASQAPWSRSFSAQANFITDGPCMHRCAASGELLMLWSSKGFNSQYCVGIARSKTGKVRGPWVHDEEPLFIHDGGHAMISRVRLSNKRTRAARAAKAAKAAAAAKAANKAAGRGGGPKGARGLGNGPGNGTASAPNNNSNKEEEQEQEHYLLVLALHSPNREMRSSAPRLYGIVEDFDATTGKTSLACFDFQTDDSE